MKREEIQSPRIHTEDKLSYCKFGVEKELEFVKDIVPQLGLDIVINPDKELNKYAPDLLYNNELADLKTQLAPFFTAGRYNKDPQYTVTINKKDLVRYWTRYRDITIFFWIRFKSEYRFKVRTQELHGVWKTDLDTLYQLKSQDKLPIHSYINRQDDKLGNAKDSYLVDLRDLTQIKLFT